MHTGNSIYETKKNKTHQTPPSLAKVILAGERQRERSWRLLRTESGAAVVVNLIQVGQF